MASYSGTLYTGITNDLERRVWEHKNGINKKSFSQKYGCTRLVYHEQYDDPDSAIDREKQLKNWRRSKKEFLIQKMNPKWKDLSKNWY